MASKRLALWAVGMYHASNDGTVVAVAALFPILLTQGLVGSYTEIGLLTLVALFITIVCQILFGAWSDRASPRILLPIGMVVLGTASLLTSQANNFLMLLIFVAVARVGASFYHPIGISWVGKRFKEDLDNAMGFQSAFGDLGVILAFASSGYLGLYYGWQIPFLVWGGFALSAAVLGYLLTSDADEPPKRRMNAPTPWTSILRKVGIWIPPLAIGGAAYIITVSFGNSFLVARIGLREDVADLVIALWIGAGVLAAYSYGRISSVLGRFRSLKAAFLLIGFSGLTISLAPPPFILLPTFVVFGIALFITYPALFSFISESTEDSIGGTTFGVVFGFQLLGGAITGYVAGILADIWGIHVPFLLVMALGFLAFILLATMAHPVARTPSSTVP
ncbi:MAG: MFS transporter [Thermoplasmata archaeon]